MENKWLGHGIRGREAAIGAGWPFWAGSALMASGEGTSKPRRSVQVGAVILATATLVVLVEWKVLPFSKDPSLLYFLKTFPGEYWARYKFRLFMWLLSIGFGVWYVLGGFTIVYRPSGTVAREPWKSHGIAATMSAVGALLGGVTFAWGYTTEGFFAQVFIGAFAGLFAAHAWALGGKKTGFWALGMTLCSLIVFEYIADPYTDSAGNSLGLWYFAKNVAGQLWGFDNQRLILWVFSLFMAWWIGAMPEPRINSSPPPDPAP